MKPNIPWVLHGKWAQVTFQVLPPLVPLAWDKATLVSMPDGTELHVVDLPDLIRLKLRAGGSGHRWDVAVLLRNQPDMRDAARQWADDVGRLKDLDAWLDDPRLG